MEFQEIFTSPFTTPTTCYSCAKGSLVGVPEHESPFDRDSFLVPTDVQFATEAHVLGVRIPEADDDTHPLNLQTSSRPLPRDASSLTCVGYDVWEDIRHHNDTHTVHRVRAMTLIDPDLIEEHLLPDHETSTLGLHRPHPMVIEKDDTASTTNVSTLEMRSHHSKQNLRRHHRNTSGTSSASLISGTGGSTNNLAGGSYHRKSQSELSKGSQTTISDPPVPSKVNDETEKAKHPIDTSKGRLVLRQDWYTLSETFSTSGPSLIDRRQESTSAFALLDFRPLAPCSSRWGYEDCDPSDSFTGIWVGSADDATLRFYMPSSNDPKSLVSVVLPEEHFSVESPVMALDFCSISSENNKSSGRIHALAIACQDGTIQLITWRNPSRRRTEEGSTKPFGLFGDISSQKVIVDGPLVCLKLDHNEFTSLRVVVGSLTGYVCQLTCDLQKFETDAFWEGPFMVVQNLSSIKTEESVLTVDIWENYVAIGTQLGRCLLYATRDSENYFLVWYAVLPYSVHGVSIFSGKSKQDERHHSLVHLAVTTRRSFHLFRTTDRGVEWREKPRREQYSSELGMSRLLKILEDIRTENKKSDVAARISVRDTMEALLCKIEQIATGTEDNIAVVKEDLESKKSFQDDPIPPASSDDANTLEDTRSTGPPHWEYSSSDEEVSIEPEASNSSST